jgi:hypothetical protein
MLTKIQAIKENIEAGNSFLWRVISKNDSSSAASHQMGVYIDKHFWNICFDEQGRKQANTYRMVNVDWYDGKSSPRTRFIHYGMGRKNEYRVTRLDRKFELGSIIVLIKKAIDSYYGFVLHGEQEHNEFLKIRQNTKANND